jgi:MFS family permease
MLSMQSLTFTIVAAICQPTLGAIADRWGLPAAYIALAGTLSVVMVFLFWKGRRHVPQAGMATCAPQLLEPLEPVAE